MFDEGVRNLSRKLSITSSRDIVWFYLLNVFEAGSYSVALRSLETSVVDQAAHKLAANPPFASQVLNYRLVSPYLLSQI